jgi:exosortase D (VPLPA-CTERM-specific)
MTSIAPNRLDQSAGSRVIEIVAVSAGLAALALAFGKPVLTLWQLWARPEYSHGYLIPPLALLIGWHALAEARPTPQPSWQGGAWIIAGHLLLILGILSTFNSAALYGLVLVLVGLVVGVAGTRAAWVLAPAFIYLCFAIPPPDFLYVSASTKLQLLASTLAVDALDAFGIPVGQDGNVIDLGAYRLQVAEACSGLRYLFPLVSFGVLAAILLRDRLWKRVVLVVSALPIAIGLNVARIVIVGLTVDRWGIGMAEGFLHGFEGWSIFVVCAGLLLSEVWILSRIARDPQSRFRLDLLALPRWGGIRLPALRPSALVATCGLVIVATVSLALGQRLLPVRADPAPRDLAATIPLSLGPWQGRPWAIAPEDLRALDLTHYFMADFREGPDGPPVNLYVAYYGSQSIGSAVHSPANCIPGGGWTILDRRPASLPAAAAGPDGPVIRVNRLTTRRGARTQLVYYWFDQRGRDLTEEWQVKWYLFRDRLTTGRSDGYLMRLVTDIDEGREAEAEARIRGLWAVAGVVVGASAG